MKTQKKANLFGQWQLVIPAPAIFDKNRSEEQKEESSKKTRSSHDASNRKISSGMSWGNSSDAQL